MEGGGETLTVADRDEAWVFHVLAGPGGKGGAIWVAKRVPDEHMTVVANMFTVRAVNLSDSANFLGRRDMHDVARAEGWWEQQRDGAFDFTAAFSTGEYAHRYYSGRRMWRALALAAPSLALDPTVGSPLNRTALEPGQTFYPWSVPPDTPLGVPALQSIHRDSYQGTPFDQTKGLAAGPFGNPNRWAQPAGAAGAWERPISIYRVNYNHVTQLRGWLPDAVGGVTWFAPHVPHSSVYVPVYAGAAAVPDTFTRGSMMR
jgi:dipeptidase